MKDYLLIRLAVLIYLNEPHLGKHIKKKKGDWKAMTCLSCLNTEEIRYDLFSWMMASKVHNSCNETPFLDRKHGMQVAIFLLIFDTLYISNQKIYLNRIFSECLE